MNPPAISARAERVERLVTLVTVLTPLAAFILAVILLWQRAVTLPDLVVCFAMYLLTVLGITLGYHRLFTHQSFKCVAGLRWVLGIAGSMAGQGPLCFWVASHRRHHQHSDAAGDPHSPHTHGGDGWAVVRGWWHSHLGWMLKHKPENYYRLCHDLVRDPVTLAVHRRYVVWVLAGLLLPGLITGLTAGNWRAVATGILWGGLVRLFLVHHVTWSVNSVCHLFGSAPHDTGDESRNNALIAVLSLGEGWHNNHHAFPASARHGLHWWQVDPSYLCLCGLRACGLVWALRVPAGGHGNPP